MADQQFRPRCRTAGVDMFPDHDDPDGIAEAQAVCEFCPIRQACADGALARREAFGVWGGLTEADRRAIYNQAPPSTTTRSARVAQRRRDVDALVAQGLGNKAIAARLGVPVDLVQKARRASGSTKRPSTRAVRTAERDVRIDAMLDAGVSVKQIRLQLHVGYKAVQRRCDLRSTTNTVEEVAA
ncbi:WhiB family transcriptional regulator [Dactylosporangium sp. NPDC000244]|uniref:WhiB family transcriptional regulator n=1 Tax=Dactylosporangium sp. NPDC000244 TaxID=3154365 RepID=UPI003333A8BB